MRTAGQRRDEPTAAPLPPPVRELPLLGNTLDLFHNPVALFVKAYQQLGPIFRVQAPGRAYTVLARPEATLFLAQGGEEYLSSRKVFSNINAILAQRLARTNRLVGPAHRAETIWLTLDENPGSPLEHLLAFHIVEALAVRSRKRVLLIDLSEHGAPLAPRFATQSDRMRPSLLECVRDPGSLRRHWAPTVTSAS